MPLSLQGIPAVYIHCLTATPNDVQGVERTGRTRSINRRKWDRGELEDLLSDASTPSARVFAEYRRRLLLRRAQPAFQDALSRPVERRRRPRATLRDAALPRRGGSG